VGLPWAEGRSRFTALFERLAIDVLRECDITGAQAILRISWDEAWHLVERAVSRGVKRKARRLPARLGVDEKAVAKGHTYMTLVCDLETSTIEHEAEDRKRGSLETYFEQFTEEERAEIKAVAMDMWAPYEDAVRTQVPKAEDKIVFDLLHHEAHERGGGSDPSQGAAGAESVGGRAVDGHEVRVELRRGERAGQAPPPTGGESDHEI
jgi:transposase